MTERDEDEDERDVNFASKARFTILREPDGRMRKDPKDRSGIPSEEDLARMSEGMCPLTWCHQRLVPPDRVASVTVATGVCPEHGWFTIRHYRSRFWPEDRPAELRISQWTAVRPRD